MPAVTVSDVLVLPRVPLLDLSAVKLRPPVSVTTAPRGFEGEGFPVRRAFHGVDLADLDPFIHLDQMGEVEYAPGEPKGTPWHPHRGFETVTYMLDGKLQHWDTHGGGGLIGDGDTQWMTAGSGLLHIEAPPEEVVMRGGLFHGFQLWVNLPAAKKWSKPRYQDLAAHETRLIASHDGGALLRLIAGELAGLKGPGATHTPITLIHATLEAGARVALPWRPDFNALMYILSGDAVLLPMGRKVSAGQLVRFGVGQALEFAAEQRQSAKTPKLDVLVLGGLPIREPVAWHGPFVMNTKDELQVAFDDFRAGRLGVVPALHTGGNVTPKGAV